MWREHCSKVQGQEVDHARALAFILEWVFLVVLMSVFGLVEGEALTRFLKAASSCSRADILSSACDRRCEKREFSWTML